MDHDDDLRGPGTEPGGSTTSESAGSGRDEAPARRPRRDEDWTLLPAGDRSAQAESPRVRQRSGIEEMPERRRPREPEPAPPTGADRRRMAEELAGRERRAAQESGERRPRPDPARPERPRAERPQGEKPRPPRPSGGRVDVAKPSRDSATPRPPRGERGAHAARPDRPAKPRVESQARKDQRTMRPAKVDYAADRAMGTPFMDKAALRAKAKADRRTKQGPALLDDSTRAKLEALSREGNGLRAAWAAFRVRTDDIRRRNYAARAEQVIVDGFDRSTAQLTDRGFAGEGGGRMNVVGRPVEYRATTAQVAGLWPWSVGAGAPLIGTPLGSHLHTGAPVCFDPMNWFLRGSFITAPSLFVLGLNGFGKSSLVRRIVLGGIAQGITPLILADVKPDYRKMVELVGGQVIDLGYGHGKLNPLAAGVLGSVVPMLDEFPALQLQVLQDLRARQVTLIAGLVELVRGARVRDYEETLIATALRILYQPGSGYTPDQPPIMENLLEVIVAGGDELRLDAGADDVDEYNIAIKGLRRSLRALTQGPFGAIFNGQTSVPIDTSAVAVCIDVSHIPTGDKKLKAAVMLACWADGFASVEAAHVLSDADLGPQRYFQVVMDELWQVLGLGDFMVDRVDELTRLQRGIATSLIMISHTIKDLQALGSEAAIAKALGFLERARAKIFGALPGEEVKRLDSIVPFTSAETEMVTGWSAPQALTGEALKPGQQRPSPPGTGKFLIKIGEDRRPGIPFHMEFTLSERESGIHDTNSRFSEFTESTARGTGSPGSAA
ncbi:hypothetical protein [Nocardia goodfellowii]|uniref:Type IV secretory pathway, VirB4 components n=1 Tax=Nocardia goodfellowii TaxID=882446 RepID=A0ABS4QG10_9NOCA|nr:hypothetical protein [Nocardia goodfellowii]MBP2190641.1 hypothetical protein [Nocardia goodfellowii]